jgi:hypothetical protein
MAFNPLFGFGLSFHKACMVSCLPATVDEAVDEFNLLGHVKHLPKVRISQESRPFAFGKCSTLINLSQYDVDKKKHLTLIAGG